MNTTIQNNNLGNSEAPKAVRAAWDGQIESVKRQVFADYKSSLGNNDQLLRLALIEADVLARQTEYPQLFFPALAAEKARNAARWQLHQRYLLRNNSVYALAA